MYTYLILQVNIFNTTSVLGSLLVTFISLNAYFTWAGAKASINQIQLTCTAWPGT